jgi:hypothetical protein
MKGNQMNDDPQRRADEDEIREAEGTLERQREASEAEIEAAERFEREPEAQHEADEEEISDAEDV